MNKLKAVLRLADQGLSQRQIAACCALGQATVSDCFARARAAGLPYEDIANWPDEQLLAALGVPEPTPRQWRRTAEPDFASIRRELQADKNVTLPLLWHEDRESHPDGWENSGRPGVSFSYSDRMIQDDGFLYPVDFRLPCHF